MRSISNSSRLGSSLFRALLGTVCTAPFFLGSSPALAACAPAMPADGGTVSCTEDDSIGFQAEPGINNLVVTVEDGAELDESDPALDAAIGVNNGGSVTTLPASNPTSNPSLIEVTEDNGFGIRTGEDTVVVHGSQMIVGGTNSRGISVGASTTAATGTPRITIQGRVSPAAEEMLAEGDATAIQGPLIHFRDAPTLATGENRLLVEDGGVVSSNFVLSNTPGDRHIAVLGSSGTDVIENRGGIGGRINLGDGDDHFILVGSSGVVDDTHPGLIDGGPGIDDTFEVTDSPELRPFQLNALVNFETFLVGGGSGWQLRDGDGFMGTVQLSDNGRLLIPSSDPLRLGGNFTSVATGRVDTTLDPTGAALTINGDAIFAGVITVANSNPIVVRATPYPLVAVSGSVTGTFSDVQFSALSDFKTFSPVYSEGGLSVLVAARDISDIPQNSNEAALFQNLVVISGAAGVRADLSDFVAQFESGNINGSAAAVFAAISPEAYDAQTTVLVESGRQIAQLLFSRTRDCVVGQLEPWTGMTTPIPCHQRKLSPWLTTIGSSRQRDAFTSNPEYDAQMGGLAFGLDARPSDALGLTLTVASQRGSIDVDTAGQSTLTTIDLAAQAVWTQGPFRVQGLVGWGHGFHQDRRRVRIATPSPISNRATEDHESDRVTLAAEAGVEMKGGPFVFEPLFGFDWSWVFQDEISESGAGGLGLQIDERDDEIGSVSGGFRISSVYHHTRYLARQLEWLDGVWRPQVDVRYRQIVEGNERQIDARFSGATADIPGFRINTQEDQGGWEVGAGLGFVPTRADRLQFDLRYDAYVASHTLEHDLMFRVQLGF